MALSAMHGMQVVGVEHQPINKIPNSVDLPTATHESARRLYVAVAEPYLAFRRIYYHDPNPSLATEPPQHNGVQQASLAQLADRILQGVPKVVKEIPLLGTLITHLQQLADIHSLSEQERTTLHNLTMLYLHGVKDGIQPWFVEWYLASAENLGHVTHPTYFIEFPFDGLLYLPDGDVQTLKEAVSKGQVPVLEQAIQLLGERLIGALQHPIDTQVELAFTGPEGRERRTAFDMKTAAALALGGFLVLEETRHILHPPLQAQPPTSQLAAFPPEVDALIASHA